jgi:mono/diheme cytochrome c family protein
MRPRLALRLGLGVSLLGAVAPLGCTGKYIRDTNNEVVTSTPERLARGSYLVNQAMACGACHTPRQGGTLLGGERPDRVLAGTTLELRPGGIKVWAPNLTPDVETGLGGWSDDEIMRAVRDGVGKDGRLMFPMMPFSSYQHVSDEDLRAVVAYLRSVRPVKNRRALAKNEVGFFVGLLIDRGAIAHEPAHDVPPPPRPEVDQLAYGEYVMRLGHCWECHSATGSGPRDVGESGFLAGWDEAQEYAGVGKVYFRNLTPDRETGLGRYSADEIKRALRDGKRLDGKPMALPMSLFIPHLGGMSDQDLDALVAFMRSVPAFANRIPERALVPSYERSLRAR